MKNNALSLTAAQTAAPLIINSGLKQKPNPYTKANLKRQLKESPECNNKLYKHVLRWILREANRGYGVKSVIDDLRRSGCESGGVSHLIYHQDTKRFYILFMDDIHDLMDEHEASTGQPLQAKGNRANWYAWYGFEAMVGKISEFLEQEEAEQAETSEE